MTFDSDNAAIIDKLRRDKGIGVSKAVNDLIRRACVAESSRHPFKQRTAPLGALIDIRNTAEVLDLLEGSTRR
ncbi:MAG: hypothetical protein M1483_05460 [Actinobacteria bacterium]|nr:hypothetical protein [Actinomycetota bacterium]